MINFYFDMNQLHVQPVSQDRKREVSWTDSGGGWWQQTAAVTRKGRKRAGGGVMDRDRAEN